MANYSCYELQSCCKYILLIPSHSRTRNDVSTFFGEVSFHALRLGDALAIALSACDNTYGIGVFFHSIIGCIKSALQHLLGFIAYHLTPENYQHFGGVCLCIHSPYHHSRTHCCIYPTYNGYSRKETQYRPAFFSQSFFHIGNISVITIRNTANTMPQSIPSFAMGEIENTAKSGSSGIMSNSLFMFASRYLLPVEKKHREHSSRCCMFL